MVRTRSDWSPQAPTGGPRGGSLRLAGVPVRVTPSFSVVVALVAVSFWLRFALRFDQAASAGLALAAAVLFVGSLAAHELAHAVEARHRGLAVAEIRFGMLGGATRITSEMGGAGDELALALAGPWTSIVLAWGFGLLAWGADAGGLSAAGELAGVLGWMNALLGGFNLLPAAPLDGGRVLDGLVWWATGRRALANRVATGAGVVFGASLVGLGAYVALVLEGGVVEGLWLVLLGVFLARTAMGERQAFLLGQRLEGHLAGELAREVTPAPSVPVEATVEEALLAGRVAEEDELVLVVGAGEVLGIVRLTTLARLQPEERWARRVGELMTPLEALGSVDADAPARDLLVAVEDAPLVVRGEGAFPRVVTEARLVAALERLGEPVPGAPAPRAGSSSPRPPRALAPPGTSRGRRRRRVARVGLVAVSGAVVLAGLGLVPMPLVELAPGPALGVPSLLRTNAPVHPIRGRLLLTTVVLSAPSALGVVRALADPSRALVWQSSVVPAGVDPGDYAASQQQVFRDSVQLGAAVGLRAAGYAVRVQGGGAVVWAVASGGPADGTLLPGDVVTGLGGEPVESAADLVALLARHPAGVPVALVVRRGDRSRRVVLDGAGVDDLGRPVLGIALEDASPLVSLPFSVGVRRSDLGGPSAGLMTALSVYGLVSGVDVTKGRVIAGTGTIDAEGGVGAVGGVGQKVRGAEAAGAGVFLVPASEAALARAAASPGLRVVAVASFSAALRALASLPARR